MRICSRCSTEHLRNGWYCHRCHAAYAREWRRQRMQNFFRNLDRICGRKPAQTAKEATKH